MKQSFQSDMPTSWIEFWQTEVDAAFKETLMKNNTGPASEQPNNLSSSHLTIYVLTHYWNDGNVLKSTSCQKAATFWWFETDDNDVKLKTFLFVKTQSNVKYLSDTEAG